MAAAGKHPIVIRTYRGFDDSVVALKKKGGLFSKAADAIWALKGRSGALEDPFIGLRTTKHGENRIAHCTKYDLSGRARLITVRYRSEVILLYCGDHEDCDRWLKANRGLSFSVSARGELLPIIKEVDAEELDQSTLHHRSGPLLDRLDDELKAKLLDGVSVTAILAVQRLTTTSTAEDIASAIEAIEDSEQRSALSDVLLLLAQGRVDVAVHRAKLYTKELEEAADVFGRLEIPEIVDSEYVRSVAADHPQYPDVLKRFADSVDYKTWMTFLHPEQQNLVDRVFAGAGRVLGVSGSGKTCVVVRRAVALAERYPEGDILVLTLNEPLSELIASLIDVCCPDNHRSRITVRPFFQLCSELLLELFPEDAKSFRMTTWKSEEHIDEIWMEYYRCENNNFDATVLHGVHDSLHAQGWRAESYIREEFDWIRSALPRGRLQDYLRLERTGRAIPLQRDQRAALLEGLAAWEHKMTAVGALDVLEIAQRLYAALDRIGERYRSVIVDECQDFGTVELAIIRRLVTTGPDDLLLVGDAAQRVSTRRQSPREAGIDLPAARSVRLTRNYRNSREILLAANEVLAANFSTDFVTDEGFEIIDPEFSSFEGGFPVLLEARDPSHELMCALAHAKSYIEGSGRKACIAFAGFSLWEVRRWANIHGFTVLDGETSIGEGALFVSDLEQTKGFEFDLVCIVNCRQSALPASDTPEREWVKELSRLYVAMTRAKMELCVSYSGTPSPFLENVGDTILRYHWEEYADLNGALPIDLPEPVELFRDNGDSPIEPDEMTGQQALFRPEAVGVPVDLAAQLRNLVDGTGRTRVQGGRQQRIRWRNMQEAADALRKEASARNLWGSTRTKEFMEFASRLGVRI